MEKKHQVHNVIILDESGSMSSIKDVTIQGFNEIIQTAKGIEDQFPEQEHLITFVSFNGLGRKTIHFNEPVKKINEINAKTYQPDASTPLFDAMGYAFNRVKALYDNEENYNVLVTILTDGEENASREFSGLIIKRIIEELKEKNWTFTYIGTDHDVEKFATSISISNHIHFSKDTEGINMMFAREKKSRFYYSEKIRRKENTKEDYYKDKDDNTPEKESGN
jgi:hypothetical protein